MSNKTSDKNVGSIEKISQTSDKNVANIEDDVTSQEAFNELIDNFEVVATVTMYGRKLIKHYVKKMKAEREQDKKRIQELEQALLKVKDKNTTLFITCRNSIPKQKVIDALNRHKFAYEELGKKYDNTHYEDDEMRARDFYMIVTEDRIVQVLQGLLGGKSNE